MATNNNIGYWSSILNTVTNAAIQHNNMISPVSPLIDKMADTTSLLANVNIQDTYGSNGEVMVWLINNWGDVDALVGE